MEDAILHEYSSKVGFLEPNWSLKDKLCLNTRVTTSQLGLKFKSKKELYQLMVTEANVYMPPIKLSNCKYVAGVIEGSIKVNINICQ